MPSLPFLKRLEALVQEPITERTPEDAYRMAIDMLRREAEAYYERVLDPNLPTEKYLPLRAEHQRLMEDITILQARLGVLEGKPLPSAPTFAGRRPQGRGGYGER